MESGLRTFNYFKPCSSPHNILAQFHVIIRDMSTENDIIKALYLTNKHWL